ncbi:hypothetical protein KY325_00785, partial [Candidatus Woesearchaeota archaeon]|nr:hypothetical protein [Candidatus Woesearchaeota archaeon]
NAAGDLDLDNIMPGFDDYFIETLARESLALESPNVKGKKKKKKKTEKKPEEEEEEEGKEKSFKPTKEKPGFVRDPCIAQFIKENASALAAAELRGAKYQREKQIIGGKDALEKAISDKEFLEQANRSNLQITVEPITSYVARKKGQIQRMVSQNLGEIVSKPEIRTIAGKMLQQYSPIGDYELKTLVEVCSDPSAIFELYQKLCSERDQIQGEDAGEPYVICFRQITLKKLAAACTNDAVSKEDFDTCKRVTKGWVGRAKGADKIRKSRFMQDEIIPDLREKEEDEKARDKIFNAICKIGLTLIDKSHYYMPLENWYHIIDGLWMEGLMQKEVGGELVKRSPQGAIVEYADGLGNLLKNYQRYDTLLKESFDKLLKQGRWDQKWRGLETQTRCVRFGKLLRAALPESKRRQFSHLDNPNTPLKDGSYLHRILRAYVGMNRDYFASAIEERRAKYAPKDEE